MQGASSRGRQCISQVAYVSLAEVTRARPVGLAEPEAWALLCQAVQALQDLFLSDGIHGSRCMPLVSPSSFLLSSRGRVILSLSRITPVPTHLDDYTAPEFQLGKNHSDCEIEKMLVFSLGESLKRATVTSQCANTELCRVLTSMCRQLAAERASLMHLLDVISEYSKRRGQSKPFSHIVMDLYRETIIYRHNKLDSILQTTCIQQPFSHRSELLDNVKNKPKTIARKWRTTNVERCLECSEVSGDPHKEQISVPTAPIPLYPIQRPKSICSSEELNLEPSLKTIHLRRRYIEKRNPVRRAASRLYRASSVAEPNGSIENSCIGPEFVIRASMPSKELVLDDANMGHKKCFTVIMLNGVKLEVICKPEVTTAGLLFERIVRSEKIEENYFLGLSVLISGDFVFLPSDIKLSKIITSDTVSNTMFTLFVRVRFFLPSLRGIRSLHSRHLLYLQLRRSILENQLPCTLDQLCELAGLALQAEFGDFTRKHEMNHYFLLEHYIPEVLMESLTIMEDFQEILTQGHIQRRGISSDKAKEDFILLAQTLPYYGVHFYSATLVNKNTKQDVWISVSAHGISLFERKGILIPNSHFSIYEVFKWQSIQTLCYSKHFLCILPHANSNRKGLLRKYKLKMDHKKSYYTFRLASLHHQFFLRLRTEYGSLNSLSQQFGVLLKDIKNEANSLFKLTSNNQHDKNMKHNNNEFDNFERRTLKCKRSKSVNELSYSNLPLEEFQNKENENPRMLAELQGTVHNCYISNTSIWDKRKGVKMGTRAFYSNDQRISRSLEAVNSSPNEEIEKMSLDSSSRLSSVSSSAVPKSDVYVLNSSIKSLNDNFLPDFQESLSLSLIEKLKNLSFADERILKSVSLHRDVQGSLGIEVTEGSDGKVYIQSIVPFGLASINGNIHRGDQIIAVNGLNLLNLKYDEALNILKKTDKKVELVLSQLPRSSCLHTSFKAIQKTTSHFYVDEAKTFLGSGKENKITKVLKNDETLFDFPGFLQMNESISNNYPYISYPTYSVTKRSPIKHSIPDGEFIERNTATANVNERTSIFCKAHSTNTCGTSLNNDICEIVESNCNSDVAQIALPRSLGLGRRWKGPVRYPVTPIKNPPQYSLSDTSKFLDNSSDEQIFI